MKGIVKRGLGLAMVGCLAASMLSGCGKTPEPEKLVSSEKQENTGKDEKQKAKADTSKKVDLVFYLMGDAPNDMQAVQDKINERLLEEINATVTFNFTTWTDWQTKYNMILSSGEPCDLIYTANWIDYAKLCKNDAFTPLDELLPEYAPELWETISKDLWAQMKVDGKVYSVPSSKAEYTNVGVKYREDLRKKYSLPVPDSLANIEAYLGGVKEKEPTQGILLPVVNTSAFDYSLSSTMVLQAKYGWVNQAAMYGLAADYNNPSKLFNYWASDAFREDMKMMKRWADKGFWSKSVLSNSNIADAFENGQNVMVIDGENPAKYTGNLPRVEKDHPDWEVGYIPYAEMTGVAFANHATGNGTAIPSSSKNPERAAMALELLYTDQELNRLIQYGIEGSHYTIDENGLYVEGEKYDDYRNEGANTWNLRNPKISLLHRNDVKLNEIFDRLHTIAQKTKYPDANIIAGFIEVPDSYAAERAALSTVMVQYLAPIEAGLVPDVDAAIDTFLQKAEQAGLSKIQKEYTAQWEAYCNEYGYN